MPASRLGELALGQGRPLGRGQHVADGQPGDGAEELRVLGQRGVLDAVARRARLRHDDVALAEEVAQHPPHRLLLDVLVGLHRREGEEAVLGQVRVRAGGVVRFGRGLGVVGGLPNDVLHGQVAHHLAAKVDLRVGKGHRLGGVGQAGEDEGVGAAKVRAEAQHQVRRAEEVLRLLRVVGAPVEAVEVGQALVDYALGEARRPRRPARGLDQISDLVRDAHGPGLAVDEDHGLLRGGNLVLKLGDGGVVRRGGRWLYRRYLDLRAQPLVGYPHVDHVDRHLDVHGPAVYQALRQRGVDLLGRRPRVPQLGLGDGDVGVHLGEAPELAVVEGVVNLHPPILRRTAGHADDVHDGGALGVGARDGVDGGQLTDAKGGDEGAEALGAGVAVGRVAGVELVGVAHPADAGRFDVVEEGEVEVAGHAVHGPDAQLRQALEEVLCHGDGHFCVFFLQSSFLPSFYSLFYLFPPFIYADPMSMAPMPSYVQAD